MMRSRTGHNIGWIEFFKLSVQVYIFYTSKIIDNIYYIIDILLFYLYTKFIHILVSLHSISSLQFFVNHFFQEVIQCLQIKYETYFFILRFGYKSLTFFKYFFKLKFQYFTIDKLFLISIVEIRIIYLTHFFSSSKCLFSSMYLDKLKELSLRLLKMCSWT